MRLISRDPRDFGDSHIGSAQSVEKVYNERSSHLRREALREFPTDRLNFLMNQTHSRMGDFKVGYRRTIKAADKCGFSVFAAEADIGGPLQILFYRVFDHDFKLAVGVI